MAAGKLVLLLIVGGLAGAVFAGMTTGAMRPYRDAANHGAGAETAHRDLAPANDAGYGYAAPPVRQSWLDEGLSLIDSPAWPFGPGSSGEDAAPPYSAPQGYAADGYPTHGGYDDEGWVRGDLPGRRDMRNYDDYADERYGGDRVPASPGGDSPAPAWEQAAPPRRQSDTASDAARRAADAAQDVMAAESAN